MSMPPGDVVATQRKITMRIVPNATLLASLSRYHPVVIEGTGNGDPRDPVLVARQIHSQLLAHWSPAKTTNNGTTVDNNNNNNNNHNNHKPLLVMSQGDPLSDRGISAITPLVAELLGVSRGLVTLDSYLDAHHSPNADRRGVVWEAKYSDMASVLEEKSDDDDLLVLLDKLESTVDLYIHDKNEKRQQIGKSSLKDYFKTYAMLQEVTKAACLRACGDITVAHTADNISEFSVTSFYKVGLELGLVNERHMVKFGEYDELDFDSIDKR